MLFSGGFRSCKMVYMRDSAEVLQIMSSVINKYCLLAVQQVWDTVSIFLFGASKSNLVIYVVFDWYDLVESNLHLVYTVMLYLD